jgi:hypothetical protein
MIPTATGTIAASIPATAIATFFEELSMAPTSCFMMDSV